MWLVGTHDSFVDAGNATESTRDQRSMCLHNKDVPTWASSALCARSQLTTNMDNTRPQPSQVTMPSAAVLTIQTHLLTGFYKRPTFEKMGTTEGRSQEPPVWVDFAAEDAFLLYQSFREMHTKFIVWCVVRAMFLSLHLGTWTFPW